MNGRNIRILARHAKCVSVHHRKRRKLGRSECEEMKQIRGHHSTNRGGSLRKNSEEIKPLTGNESLFGRQGTTRKSLNWILGQASWLTL